MVLGSPYAEGSLAVRKWVLECGGQTFSGEVPEDGTVKVRLPSGAKEAILRLDPEKEGGGLVWKLALALIPPIEETKGLQIRLNNLGFFRGAEDGVLGKRTKVGIRIFQQRHGLPVTGEPDEATLAKVKALYGG
ncbi:MAG TPA: peptidoglycan-binding domain-containing protein [Fibrobacteria bacterium]|nr:peptidoglycan-binding domain-containing protein [Fibrobacteria bacterium]